MTPHETLPPLGEFAIGTNTVAYVMAKKYGIASILPILIGEKAGPHFAIGDTCYLWSEDTKTYNSNGKRIAVKDNEISIKRKVDVKEAYLNKHTDITIPYDELDTIIGYDMNNGGEYKIIEGGRFVLEGTQVLNEPPLMPKQEIRMTTFKEMNKEEKIEHIWEYYKLHIIAGITGLVIIYSFFKHLGL